MDFSFLKEHKLIPVVVLHKLDETMPTLEKLMGNGVRIAEITFRTDCAADAIALAAKESKRESSPIFGMLVGAGTVINAEQCMRAIEAGAQFIVSPGLSKDVFDVCDKAGVPYLAGVATPTEVMAAKALGLDTLKFFPAGALGGVKTLGAIAAAFPDVKFVPTGGINAESANEYLEKSFVIAVGGSWMVRS